MADNYITGCGIHHIAVRVSDFEAAKKFYLDGLGFTIFKEWGAPDRRIALVDTGNGNYLEIFSGAPAGTINSDCAGSLVHIALRVSDARAAYERAIACGAVPHILPKDTQLPSEPPFPVSIAFVKGPDGEIIEFFQERG